MTRILVSDTSVLIDLERGNLIEAAFRLSGELVVPDLLYDRELKAYNGPELVGLGLRVESLDGAGVNQALGYRRQVAALSLPDAFALSIAKTEGDILLTGDKALRTLAGTETVECHGVLWVLDQMNHEGAATIQEIHDGLQLMAGHPRCRLPRGEVTKRLNRLAKALAEGSP
jgi:hypothetical protein